MRLGYGKLVPAPASDDTATRPRRAARPSPRLGRVEPGEVVAAAERARAIVERAQTEAERLLAQARADATTLRDAARDEGRAEAAAELASRTLALAARERDADERSLDRLVEVGRLLAERLLGEALRLEPSRVAALARQALTEAQGARRIQVVAHPEDAPLLERALAERGVAEVTRVVADATRTRGNLRLETELGTLDASLAPQLDRLVRRLRASLGDD